MEHFEWNDGWQFFDEWSDELKSEGEFAGGEKVRLPHSVCFLPYNYCDDADYQKVSGYRRVFDAPLSWRGKSVLLTFGAAAHDATVFCNGKEVARHRCGYMAFTIDLSENLNFGGKNTLAVKCDSRENLDQPPFGGVIDYLTYGGLYRQVWLDVKNPVHFENPHVIANADGSLKILRLPKNEKFSVKISVEREGKIIFQEKTAAKGFFEAKLENPPLWSPENPALCNFLLELLDEKGEIVDCAKIRTGFRTIDFRAEGLFVNGKKIALRGLNRHQSWPYIGYAMPARPQRLDADILKKEFACNVVRTSHYPQSHDFIGRCDEIGLLVFCEIPGWQHIGGAEWKKIALQNVREMVCEYRNHPSIFLWGTRINESPDDDALYQKTCEIARECDPSRPTGGVRNFTKSHFFEDVYTYNDFIHSGKNEGVQKKSRVASDSKKGYLIAEHTGHMFPTKNFDWEGKRLEHALRHARVLSDSAKEKGVAGAIGWCMFDYNTHKDFGSGDRICYHGVLDMFRNPKLAAAVYASQRSADEGIVLEVSSGMDIGEHPAGSIGEIYAFTNAEKIRLYKNGEFVAEFFPDKKNFAGLPHPPVLIDDTIGCLLEKREKISRVKAEKIKKVLFAIAKYGEAGLPLSAKLTAASLLAFGKMSRGDFQRLFCEYVAPWGGESTSWRFDALIGEKVAATCTKEPVKKKFLRVRADSLRLCEGATYDVATVRLSSCDQNGNILPYDFGVVQICVEGDLELVGPATIPLRGGAAGAYFRTTGKKGAAKVIFSLDGAPKVALDFSIE